MDAEQELFAIFRAEVDEQIEDLASHLGRNPERWRLDRLFQISHNVKGAARLVGADAVRDAAHALEDLFSALRAGLELDADVVTLARHGTELLEACFAALDSGEAPPLEGFRAQVSSLTDGASGPPEAAPPATAPQSEPAATPSAAPGGGKGSAEGTEESPGSSTSADTVRVAADKLEAFSGLASELVSQVFQVESFGAQAAQLVRQLDDAMLRNPDLRKHPELREAVALGRELARNLNVHSAAALRISEELQDGVRSLRMVPVDALRTVLSRSLRDACRSTGRNAELHLSGGGTEVDRVVLEHLRNPLIHLIRNAVAHGIEDAETRLARGKTETGAVRLSARSMGSRVEITVADDGAGIDLEAVRAAALAKAVISADESAKLTEQQTLNLLFAPGMSTSESVTELAGRGVGLDVALSELRRIGGEANLTSEHGVGTTVTLHVPLTRLTTSGILVRAKGQSFAFSTSDVERTLHIKRRDLSSTGGRQNLLLDGTLVEVLPLATSLNQSYETREEMHGVVLGLGGRRRVILVDEVLDQRDFILQPLPWNLSGAFGLAGAAVLDGGDIVLVLNSDDLLGTRSRRVSERVYEAPKRHRILVVDDSTTSRTLERNILRSAGYEVMTAVNGREALEILGAETLDLVVSDVEMPEIGGFELTRRIRSHPKLGRLPVILVTSLGHEEHRREGAEAGADAYIEKGSFDQEELLRTVLRLL